MTGLSVTAGCSVFETVFAGLSLDATAMTTATSPPSNSTPAAPPAIRSFFRGASGIFSFAIHYSLNGQIEVDGDTARAQWYLFMPCTVAAGNRAMWRASIDHETYARVDGPWMFSHKQSEPLMNVPFDTVPMVKDPAGERRTWTLAELIPDGFSGRELP